jgi:signal transduction histidine kinase/CheY-like chemotaxis protein
MDSAVALYAGFLVLAALLLGVFAVVRAQSEDYRDIRRAVAVRSDMAGLFSAMQDAETGQRGFLLTGKPNFLEPYSNAFPLIDGKMKDLAAELGARPADQMELATLRDLVDAKLAELRTTVALGQAGKIGEAIALVETGSGNALMDRIRTTMAAMHVSQSDRVARGFTFAERGANWLQFGALAAVLVMAALAFVSFKRIRRQWGLLTSGHDDLLEANTKLIGEGEQRVKLADQLRQSQKMEALGQLTGGLAHDFNNMLAVIVSSLSITKRRMARGETDIARYLDSALDGAERAATLTGRLLAFSRQQPLSPVLIDPNKMVAGMSELLHRTLGETVRLETVLAAGLWRANVDTSQLENAILNLALNARDAMPEGGKLTIETSNAYLNDEYADAHKDVPAGQYVLIAVTDTGAGMAPDLFEKIFEPFFTTKPTGQGTGLGLSQVYGFVKQSGGHVAVYSELGHGSTFKLYLPRSYLDEAHETSPILVERVPPGHASEIILVVEDDERVRQLSVESLRELGYTVLHADGGAAGLRQLDRLPHIDLLFTDIVMPDMNGRELAAEALRRHPGLKILYTSGYVPNAVVHNATLGPLEDMISKPFSLNQLARKVRQVFNRPAPPASAAPQARPLAAPAPIV